MRRLYRYMFGLIALGVLSSGCQSQPQPPREGAYVNFVMEMMTASAKLSEGSDDAKPAIQAVESWRGTGDDEGTD